MTSQEYCKIAVAALEDRKAEDVKIIDIREISPVADYFDTDCSDVGMFAVL